MVIQNFDILNFLANGVHNSPPIQIVQSCTRKSAQIYTFRISFVSFHTDTHSA